MRRHQEDTSRGRCELTQPLTPACLPHAAAARAAAAAESKPLASRRSARMIRHAKRAARSELRLRDWGKHRYAKTLHIQPPLENLDVVHCRRLDVAAFVERCAN